MSLVTLGDRTSRTSTFVGSSLHPDGTSEGQRRGANNFYADKSLVFVIVVVGGGGGESVGRVDERMSVIRSV